MASSAASVIADIMISLYEKLNMETKDTADSATEFLKSIKFDRYKESYLCKSSLGIDIDYFDTFVNKFGERYEFPQHIIDAILEGKNCKENEEVFNESEFSVGKSNHARYLLTLTRKKRGGIDFACVIVLLNFKLSKETVATVKANAFLKFFGFRSDTTELKDRKLTQEEQECITNCFRNKAKVAIQNETRIKR